MAELLEAQAVVLRSAPYRESSRMLTLLSARHGLLSASAKGVMRPKSTLRVATEPFVRGEYVLSGHAGRYTLVSAQIEDAHYALRESMEKLTCAAYLRDLVLTVAVEGEPQQALYALLCAALEALCDERSDYRAIRTYGELHGMRIAGMGAQLTQCSLCGGVLHAQSYFSPQEGGLLCQGCQGHAADAMAVLPGTVAYLQRLQRWDMHALAVLRSQERIQAELQRCWDSYLRYHLQRKFHATEFLQQLEHFTKQTELPLRD